MCSVPASEDDLGYSEENYRVGKCQICLTGNANQLAPAKCQPPPQKKMKTGNKKQAQLSSFFPRPPLQHSEVSAEKPTTSTSTDVGETSSRRKEAKGKDAKVAKRPATEVTSVKVTSERTVAVETIEKRRKTNQRYQRIKGMKYFNRTWISGCTNYRPSAAIDNAQSDSQFVKRLHKVRTTSHKSWP